MKKSVENIRLYRVYVDLINYIEMITEKYPKYSKIGFVSVIKRSLYKGMEDIIYAYKVFAINEKLTYLNDLDVTIKMLKLYARISYRKKYINVKNYEAWSRKINRVCSSLGAWINACLKQ